MKKILCLLLSAIILYACNGISYIAERQIQNTGLDFTKGKWLINEVDCPKAVYSKLYRTINQEFDAYLNGRLFITNQVNSILLPKKVVFNPTKDQIAQIKKGTLFDYFVNIKAVVIKDDLVTIDFSNHKNPNKAINRCSVILEVYDLNLTEIIYSKEITGTVKINEENNQDINFSKNTNQIILGCFKKIMKDVKKKSILK